MANPYIYRIFANGLRETASGKFYPWKTATFSAGTVLPQKQNRQYFIRDIRITYSGAAGDAGTSLSVKGYIDLEQQDIAYICRTGALAADDAVWYSVNQLLDLEKPVTFVSTGIAVSKVIITWAEVDYIA